MTISIPRFLPAPDSVDPARVPQRKLTSGATMPAIGLGTFGSDHVTPQTVADAVYDAVRSGFRHIDCASVYGNEPEIGGSLAKLFAEGLRREELWVTSKVWNNCHDDVIGSCQLSRAYLPGNSTVEMREVAIPPPGHGEVLLEGKASSICGSDTR